MIMDYKGLMVGDWVSLFQGKNDGSPAYVQVTSIGENEIGIKGEDCEYDGATAPLLFPIPLSKEFLSKNSDIETVGDSYEIDYEISGILFSFCIDTKILSIEYCEEDVSFTYVHQLQNFLTSCGKEKEFKL